MKLPARIFVIIVALAVPFTLSAQAAVKAGATCSVQGQSKILSNKKFTCIKSGKKLIWNMGVLVAVPKPSTPSKPSPSPSSSATASVPSPTPSPSVTTSPTLQPLVDPLGECKLSVLDGRGDVAIGGWPRIGARSKTIGTVNVTVVMVDFPDAPATLTPQQAFAKIEGAVDVFKEISYGYLNYTLKPQYKWYRMSKDSKLYAPLNKSFATHREYIEEATALADSEVDFSQTDNLLILANPDAQGLGNAGPAFTALGPYGITLDGNTIMNGATSAYDLNYWKSIWLNHEITHAMGLPDLYAFTVEDSTNRYDGFRYTGEFSYMGLSSYDSNSPSLLAFERWNLGWIQDSQVVCSKDNKQTHTLSAIESIGGLKAVIVPLDYSKVLVVESRRAIGIDRKMVKNGALVYVVDSSVQSGRGPIQVYPRDIKSDPRYVQAPRAVGEKVTIAGYTVTVVKSDGASDTIEIVKG